MTPNQDALTERLLAPHQAEIEAYLWALRAEVDAVLAPRLQAFSNKAYPLGRCREIRDGVFDRILAAVRSPDGDVPTLLRQFIAAGGVGRKVWGDLRGAYFQNAMQLGAWYVDVANDTVTPTKPKVEIVAFAQSDMRPILDFQHFAAVATRYWEVTVYANTVLPRLAPMFPLISAGGGGQVWLGAACDPMIELTRRDGFRPAEQALAVLPPPPHSIAKAVSDRAAAMEDPLLAQTPGIWHAAERRFDEDTVTSEVGRGAPHAVHAVGGAGDAIGQCRIYRDQGLGTDDVFRDACVAALLKLSKTDQPPV